MTMTPLKKLFKYASVLLVLMVLVAPQVSDAKVIYRSGKTVSLNTDQTVDGNFYVTAETASLSGTVSGDVYGAGGLMTLNGSVDEDVLLIAGTVQMYAEVGDDVRIIGGDVTVAEHVAGDLVVLGGTVKVLSTASVDGDILIYGGEVEIEAPVEGSIMGATSRLRIDAPVTGDIDVQSGELLLGDRASVGGSVRYVSPAELVRSPGAVVEGDISHNMITQTVTSRQILQSLLIPLFIMLFAALTLFLFVRPQVTMIAMLSRSGFWLKSLIGMAAIIGLPVLSSLLFATIIGSLVGFTTLLLWLLLMVFAVAMLPIVAGQWIASLTTKQPVVSILFICVGALAVELAVFVPVIGFIAVLLFFATIIGTVLQLVYRALS